MSILNEGYYKTVNGRNILERKFIEKLIEEAALKEGYKKLGFGDNKIKEFIPAMITKRNVLWKKIKETVDAFERIYFIKKDINVFNELYNNLINQIEVSSETAKKIVNKIKKSHAGKSEPFKNENMNNKGDLAKSFVKSWNNKIKTVKTYNDDKVNMENFNEELSTEEVEKNYFKY
jgi:hypothetical protein